MIAPSFVLDKNKWVHLKYSEHSDGAEWVVELDEGGQTVKIPSYKINNYWGYNVQHDNYNEHCYMAYLKFVKRVNPEFSL